MRYRTRSSESGVTLVELMIALLLGLILTSGMIQIFIGNRATYSFNEGLSRLQENARFALDHMANDTRMAGYVGCLSSLGVTNTLDIEVPFRDDVAGGLQGYEFGGTGAGAVYAAADTNPAPSGNANAWNPSLPPELDGLVIPGSDVLVVRRVSSQSRTLVPPFSDADELFPDQPETFEQGELVVVSDCRKATIFQVTNDPAADMRLAHAAGGFNPGNGLASWPVEQFYGLGSEVAALETIAFFVGQGAEGTPSLFQLRLETLTPTQAGFGVPDELVDSIDSMQVRYGRDADNDGTIDAWLTAGAVADWTEILSAEISLLARASEEYGTEVDVGTYGVGGMTFDPVDDRRLRRVFSTVVGLRNRLP